MLTLIILVLGLMAATAVIAYWSDNLGKKLGKKRVTLFGLRPKQTATLITITSSMPIMLFTLATLLIVHPNLRRALTRYDAERRRFEIGRQENEGLSKKNEWLLARNVQAAAEEKKASENAKKQTRIAQEAGAKAEQARKSTEEAEKREREARKRESEAQKRASEAQQREREASGRARRARVGEKKARQEESRARLAAKRAQGQLRNVQSLLKTAQAQFALAKSQLAGTRAQLASTRAELASTQVTLASTKADLASTQANLASTQANLASTNIQLKTRSDKVIEQGAQILAQEAKVAGLTGQIEGYKAEAEQSRAAVQLVNQELASVRTALDDVQTTPSLVPAGETLAERVIAPRQSPSQISAALDALLDEARTQARRLGESVGKLNMSLVFPELTVTDAEGNKLMIDEAMQKSILTSQLARADSPSSVRVITARSHTISESKIQVRLRPIEVRTAFGRGDVLASTNINGRDGDAAIFKQLLDLANKGQGTAEQKGVVPPLSRDVPFYAPRTNERIFEALRSIQALKGLAVVRIVATDDLSTASPLRVRFEVAPAASARPSA